MVEVNCVVRVLILTDKFAKVGLLHLQTILHHAQSGKS